jgi:hypothetical protein
MVQVEPDGNITLHTAYSSLLQLTPTRVLVVWERGPMHACTPNYPDCSHVAGEYQTLRAREIVLPMSKGEL